MLRPKGQAGKDVRPSEPDPASLLGCSAVEAVAWLRSLARGASEDSWSPEVRDTAPRLLFSFCAARARHERDPDVPLAPPAPPEEPPPRPPDNVNQDVGHQGEQVLVKDDKDEVVEKRDKSANAVDKDEKMEKAVTSDKKVLKRKHSTAAHEAAPRKEQKKSPAEPLQRVEEREEEGVEALDPETGLEQMRLFICNMGRNPTRAGRHSLEAAAYLRFRAAAYVGLPGDSSEDRGEEVEKVLKPPRKEAASPGAVADGASAHAAKRAKADGRIAGTRRPRADKEAGVQAEGQRQPKSPGAVQHSTSGPSPSKGSRSEGAAKAATDGKAERSATKAPKSALEKPRAPAKAAPQLRDKVAEAISRKSAKSATEPPPNATKVGRDQATPRKDAARTDAWTPSAPVERPPGQVPPSTANGQAPAPGLPRDTVRLQFPQGYSLPSKTQVLHRMRQWTTQLDDSRVTLLPKTYTIIVRFPSPLDAERAFGHLDKRAAAFFSAPAGSVKVFLEGFKPAAQPPRSATQGPKPAMTNAEKQSRVSGAVLAKPGMMSGASSGSSRGSAPLTGQPAATSSMPPVSLAHSGTGRGVGSGLQGVPMRSGIPGVSGPGTWQGGLMAPQQQGGASTAIRPPFMAGMPGFPPQTSGMDPRMGQGNAFFPQGRGRTHVGPQNLSLALGGPLAMPQGTRGAPRPKFVGKPKSILKRPQPASSSQPPAPAPPAPLPPAAGLDEGDLLAILANAGVPKPVLPPASRPQMPGGPPTQSTVADPRAGLGPPRPNVVSGPPRPNLVSGPPRPNVVSGNAPASVALQPRAPLGAPHATRPPVLDPRAGAYVPPRPTTSSRPPARPAAPVSAAFQPRASLAPPALAGPTITDSRRGGIPPAASSVLSKPAAAPISQGPPALQPRTSMAAPELAGQSTADIGNDFLSLLTRLQG